MKRKKNIFSNWRQTRLFLLNGGSLPELPETTPEDWAEQALLAPETDVEIVACHRRRDEAVIADPIPKRSRRHTGRSHVSEEMAVVSGIDQLLACYRR